MISATLAVRSLKGFRLISMRPLLRVGFVPSIPMKEERLATAGSRRITRASACWRLAISVKETDWGPSEMPRTRPVSSTGKNPFGTMT